MLQDEYVFLTNIIELRYLFTIKIYSRIINWFKHFILSIKNKFDIIYLNNLNNQNEVLINTLKKDRYVQNVILVNFGKLTLNENRNPMISMKYFLIFYY
jgi:hypothetical protein